MQIRHSRSTGGLLERRGFLGCTQRRRPRPLAILIAIMLLFAVAAMAQVAGDFQTVATEDGMIVVDNNKAQRFSFLVAGKNPQRGAFEGESFLVSTDNAALSESLLIFFAKNSSFLDKTKTYTEAEILTAHRDKSIAGLEKAYGSMPVVDEKTMGFVKVLNPANKTFPTKLISTFTWSYLSPVPGNTDRAIFQTVAIGDGVLTLGTVFKNSIKPETVRAFFTQTLESLALLPPHKPVASPKSKPKSSVVKH